MTLLIPLLLFISLPSILSQNLDTDAPSIRYEYNTRINSVSKILKVNLTSPAYYNHFKDFVSRSDFFIDKTLLIKEIIESKDKLIIITCPSKWGKTLNLDMIKNFFEIEVDRNGNEYIPKKKTFNYELFQQHTVDLRERRYFLQKPFLISEYPDLMTVYQGRHPVIFLNLANITGLTYDEIYNAYKRRISRTFVRHKYMIGVIRDGLSEFRNEHESKRERIWKQFCKYAQNGQVPEIELEESLRFLSRILYHHFGRRVYLLIDDYDVPITQMLHGSYFRIRDEQKLIKFYQSFMHLTFDNNQYIEKSILMGQMRLGGKQRPLVNNIVDYPFINPILSDYFGFNRREVDSIFEYFDISEDLATPAHQWFGGYKLASNNFQPRYNPFSITRFVYEKEMLTYWVKPYENLYISKILEVRPVRGFFEAILVDNNVTIHFTEYAHTDNMIRLKMIAHRENIDTLDFATINLLLTYLSDIGYLICEPISYNATRESTLARLRVSSEEIRHELFIRLRIFYSRREGITPRAMDTLSQCFHAFITTPNATTVELIQTLWKFYSELPIFSQTLNRYKLYVTNGQLLQSIRNYLSLKMYQRYRYQVWVQRKIASNPDMIFFTGDMAVIVKIHYNSRGADFALDEAKSYTHLVHCRKDIKRVKCIGIAITLGKDVYAESVELPIVKNTSTVIV